MIKAFTDGSCLINPSGPGGWSVVIAAYDDISVNDKTIFFSGGDLTTTNNRMELTGVYEALKWIKNNNHTNVIIFSDSKYVVNTMNDWMHGWYRNGWSKKKGTISNLDIIKPMYPLYLSCKVRLEWVKGHNGQVFNEFADSLANKVALEFAEKRYAKYDTTELGHQVCIKLNNSYFTTTYKVEVKFESSSSIYLVPVNSKFAKPLMLSAEQFDNGCYIKI